MIITAEIWDKQSEINGKSSEFLKEHFKKQNGNDDRVIISYDGVIGRIEYVNDLRFTIKEKSYLQNLISQGISYEHAIAETWGEKARLEYEEGERQSSVNREMEVMAAKIERMSADLQYTAIMMGVDLDV